MGCDIHFYVETQNENGQWDAADHFNTDDDDYRDVDYGERFYTGRNYNLFAILADVRNGFGFAGVDTGEPLEPIDKPRGLPDDVCADVKQSSDRWDCDGHSHSWFTLKELQDYDWNQTSVQRGLVDVDTYFAWKKSGDVSPMMWCGGCSSTIIDEAEIKDWQDAEIISKYGSDVRIRCEWKVPYDNCAQDFIENTLPKMAELNEDATKVRAVFWFDN